MGRLQPTVVVQPQATRRADRAKKAKDTVNKVIPELLRSSVRARNGMQRTALMVDPPATSSKVATPTAETLPKMRISLANTDTLTAARRLTTASRRASLVAGAPKPQGKPYANVCILNMASPLRPGGGFLEGATSQEEFLCMRTTLYASLWEDFYRLPEVGGIVTPDVMVFRDSSPEAEELPKRERFFVDVVSAGMLRFPETKQRAGGEEGEGACSCGASYCDKDRELVTRKMRAVVRLAQSQGAEKLILGAWGCGAYGNPVKEVAKIWKRVLVGTNRKAETWTGIKEVVFAMTDRTMAKEFEKCFADVLEKSPVSPPPELAEPTRAAPPADTPQSASNDLVTELLSKIQETELQLDQIRNPRSKARLREVLDSLNKQLAAAGTDDSADDETLLPEEGEDEDFVLANSSDGDEYSSYYGVDLDSASLDSSGFSSPGAAYEFHFAQQPKADEESQDDTISTQSSGYESAFDHQTGWFNGSMDGLHALLNKPRRAAGSPVLRPDSSGGMEGLDELDLHSYLRRYSEQDD
ncbi:hypothetical protein H2203_008753 [Taxawa tesnikishii (nom. ined.)]|nr:hypothetical protein H2203_008753 [Dothideales sp. JES 119]